MVSQLGHPWCRVGVSGEHDIILVRGHPNAHIKSNLNLNPSKTGKCTATAILHI